MSVFDDNLKRLPDLRDFFDTKNSFLNDIYWKAKRYKLTDKQVSAAQSAWDRLQARKTKSIKEAIKLSDSDVETILWSIEQMIQMRGRYGGEFWYDMRGRVQTRKTLSPKQYAAIVRSILKVRRGFFRRVFHER